jgi:hypothetical protein
LGAEKVIAVDIFRERVFLKHEEQGSRIIPLLQLREEVEQLGDVLQTGEMRGQQATPALSGGSPEAPPASRQSRRGRRGPGGTQNPPS